jgi:peptidoglycan/LPS O-acetylase OafA/YrhL
LAFLPDTQHITQTMEKRKMTVQPNIIVNEKNEYYHGIDWLRVFFCIAIVLMHTTYFTFVDNPLLNYILLYYYGMLGVPVFFQISLYLFNSKILTTDRKMAILVKRIKELLIIYAFWLMINWILVGDIASLFENPINLIHFIVGHWTPIYYIFSLIALSMISFLFSIILDKIKKNHQVVYLVIILVSFVASLGLMILGDAITHKLLGTSLIYANPLNYIPYIFSSILVVMIMKTGHEKWIIIFILFGLGMIMAFIEAIARMQNWCVGMLGFTFCYVNGVYFDYARASLVFFSMGLLCVFLMIKKTPPRIISYFSDLSMGIYVLHLITMILISRIFSSLGIACHPLVIFLITFASSTFLTIILRNYNRSIL